MNDGIHIDGDGQDLVDEFKDALYTDVEQGPARLEFERRRLMARLAVGSVEPTGRPRKRGMVLGLAAALAAAAAVVVALVVTPDGPEPGAERISLSGLWRVHPEDAIVRGTPVRVPEGAGAKLVLEDGTALWLGSGSELTVLDEAVSAVRLGSGRLLASVAQRPEGAPFRVITTLAEVTVHGTVFSVAADRGQSRVRLHEGEISLSCGPEVIDVQPGHEVEVTEIGEVALRPIDAAGALADLLLAEKTSALAGPVAPEIRLPSEEVEAAAESPVPAEVPAELELVQPPERVAPAPARQTPPPAAEAEAPEPPAEPTPPDALADPELAAIEVESRPAPSVIEQMRELMGDGRYADAIRLADAYLATDPRGQHADDALYLRAHCQARTGDLKGGRQSLMDYLTRFPEGRYWDRVRDILGE